jgi:hypothetical protein
MVHGSGSGFGLLVVAFLVVAVAVAVAQLKWEVKEAAPVPEQFAKGPASTW